MSHNSTAALLARRLVSCALIASASVVLAPVQAHAQNVTNTDSLTRMGRYMHNIGYGAALGFVWAGVDQLQDDPDDWTYGQRLASGLGEFLIQETVTDGLAWAMHRPMIYPYCTCDHTTNRIGWGLKLGVLDQLPNGKLTPAWPRIIGAYAGSFAQASWRPANGDRTQTALLNGTISLLIGGGVNVYHELRHHKTTPTVAKRN
jgi:hypothetical protein